MLKTRLFLAVLLAFGSAGGASALCTKNDVVDKVTILANQIYAHGQKNPDSFLALMDEYEKDAAYRLGKTEDAVYDEWIEKTR